MYAGVDKGDSGLPDIEDEMYDLDDLDDEDKEEDKNLDMPASWCLPIDISKRDYEMRLVWYWHK